MSWDHGALKSAVKTPDSRLKSDVSGQFFEAWGEIATPHHMII
jgi:hypothetical protein